jgi:transcriptional regulator GlxA family with amidase domain
LFISKTRKMNHSIKVGILLFNEVEVLDFAGPFEVFSLTSKNDEKLFHVITIGETGEIVTARNGLKVLPNANFKDELNLDILIIPGGYGAEEIEIKNKAVIHWITGQKNKVKILASVEGLEDLCYLETAGQIPSREGYNAIKLSFQQSASLRV